MSATARKDIQLIVRARTEGERLIESMTAALEQFRAAQSGMGADAAAEKGRLQQMAGALVALEKAYEGIAGATDRAGSASDRQRQKIEATRADLARVRAEMELAARQTAAIPTKIVDAKLGGGDTSPLVAQLAAAKATYASLEKDATRLTGSIRAQQAAIGEETSSLNALGNAAIAAEASLNSLGSSDQRDKIKGAAEAWDRQVAAMEAVAGAAREMGAADKAMVARANEIRGVIDPLAHLQTTYNRALKEARDLKRAGALTDAELSTREKQLALDLKNTTEQLQRQGRGERGRPSLFGLKPYELTNLGYQVNDVFTQLASGTSLTQTLAQQGGQLLQLFPKVGSAIIAALGNPLILAAAAGLGLVVAAVMRVRTEMERVRQFEGVLHAMGDGAAYSAHALADAADQLDRYGMSGEAAMASIRAFLNEGLAPGRIVEFGRAAQNMADVLSIEVVDAARQVGEGLTGNWEAMQRLQAATRFLSNEEEARVRTMFEEGRAAEARSEAARIFTLRMDDAARRSRGPWTDATRGLSESWTGFIDRLSSGSTTIVTINAMIDSLSRSLAELSGSADRVPLMFEAWNQAANIVDLEARLRRALYNERAQNSITGAGEHSYSDELRVQLETARQELARTRAAQMQAAAGAQGGNTVTQAEEQRRRATALHDIQFQREIADLQRQTQEAARDSDRIRLQGEIEYRLALKETNDQQIAAVRRRNAETAERQRSDGQNSGELISTARRYVGRDENIASDRGVLQELFRAAGQQNIDPRITAWCAAFVNAVLATNGIRGTNSLSARSFERFGTATDTPRVGDLAVLRDQVPGRGGRRDPNQGHVGFVTGFDRNGNVRILGGNQGGGRQVSEQTFNRREVVSFRRVPAAGGDVDPVTLDDRRAQAQAELNNQLDLDIAARGRAVDQARRLLGLSGEQLNTEQRRQTVDDAVHAAQLNAEQRGLEFDATRKAALEQIVGREYDILHAREQATRAVDDAQAERSAILEGLQQAQANGDTALVTALTENLHRVDAEVEVAIAAAIQFWRQWNTPESRTAIQGLENLRGGIARTVEEMRRAPLDQQSDRLQAIRTGLQEQIRFFRDQGQMDIAEQLRGQLAQIDGALVQTIDSLIEMWAVSSRPEAAQTLLNLQNLRNQVVTTGQEFRITAGEIQQAFAGDLTNAITQWAQAIGEGGNVLRATRDAAMSFASDFLRSLAQMLLQAWALKLAMKIGFGKVADGANSLFNAAPLIAAGGTLNVAGATLNLAGGTLTAAGVMWTATAGAIMTAAMMLMAANAMNGGGGGGGGETGSGKGIFGSFLGSLFQSVGPGLFHSGGIAGQATQTRDVWAGVFANAQRYHGGGIAGLRPREVPAVLMEGEEILARSSPRHIMNGGGGGAPNIDLAIYNGIDPAEMVAKGLGSRSGQIAVMNVIRANAGPVKALLS
jgi:uncharacterized protein (TIGR02594 family)